MINPDGSIVGGGNLSQAVQGDKIELGAILTLSFPSYVNSTQGYVLAATYEVARRDSGRKPLWCGHSLALNRALHIGRSVRSALI